MRILLTLFAVAMLCSCATFSDAKKASLSHQLNNDQFVPVQLSFHPGQRYSVDFGYRLNRIEKSLQESDQFLRIGREIDSPFVFVINLKHEDTSSAGDFAGSLLSALTLGLVPAKYLGRYTLKTNIFFHDKLLRSFEHHSDYEMKWSLYNYGETIDWENGPLFVSIHNTVMALISELVESDVLPTVKQFRRPKQQAAEQQI